jgi:4-hydroxy-tetrahydrodipicolinate reductase
VNGCTGKMGLSVAEAAASRGLHLLPVSFTSRETPDRAVRIGRTDVRVYGPSAREDVLSSVADEFPDVVVVDYTAPDSVNCKRFHIATFFYNMFPPHHLALSWGCFQDRV